MSVIYTPGNEPEKIKEKVERYFAKLATAYPDKIVMGLAKDHKEWGKQAKAIRESLGYENNKSFFEAYGFKYESKPCTPVASLVDDASVIAELKKRYEGKEKPKTIDQLKSDNPDLAGNLQTFANRAKETFGMTLAKYFKQEGILYNPEAEGSALEVLKKRYAGGPFTGTLQELKAQNTDISWWRIEKECAELDHPKSLKDYLVSQGVLVEDAFELRREKREKERAEKFTPEKSKPIVDSIVEELKKRYKNDFCLPKSPADLFAENNDIIDVDFKTHLKTAYPNERSNEFFNKKGLIRPSVEIISREMCDILKERYKNTGKKFIITKEAVNDEFGISLDLFYFIITPRRDLYLDFENYIILKSKNEEIHDVLNFADKVLSKATKDRIKFVSIDDVKVEFPEAPYGELDYEIKHSGYASNFKDYFKSMGLFASDRYYLKLSLEELYGKSCYIDISEVDLKNATKNILTQYGAIIESVYSDNTDLVLTTDVLADDRSKKHSKIVSKCINESSVNNLPVLVSAYMLIELNRVNIANLQIDISDFSLEDFNNKGCQFIEQYNVDEKAMISSIIVDNGADIKRSFSKNVDYYIVSNNALYDLKNIPKSLFLAVEQNKKNGRPIIIDGDMILEKEKKIVKNKLETINNAERLEYALSLYKIIVEKIEDTFDGEYTDPICSGDSVIRGTLRNGARISDADDFFKAIPKQYWMKTKEDGYQFYRKLYETIVDGFGCFLEDKVGIITPVVLSVASFVYGSPDCEVHIEWVRNKWELRGEFSGSFRYAFTISPSCPKGYIFKVPYIRYSMWE